jgi:hypothetical protein
MSSDRPVTGSWLEPAYWQRLPLPSIARRKRALRPLKGGEIELLERLGELPIRERDSGPSPSELLARQRFV